MNGLTVLVLIVVGVVGAYLLEEWFEKGDTNIFTKSNVIGYGPWKGGHLFSSFPEGWFVNREVLEEQSSFANLWIVASTVVLLSLIWTLINIPELFKMATVYCFIYSIALTISMLELSFPVKTWVTAIPRPVGIYGRVADIIIGVLGGLGFVGLIQLLSGVRFGAVWAVRTIPHGTIVNIWLVGICIPIAEEYFFNKFAATGVENWGVVPGILGFSVLTWLFFHWSVYGLAGFMPVVLVLFGLYRGLVLLKTKSYAGSTFAHIIVNTAMILTAVG